MLQIRAEVGGWTFIHSFKHALHAGFVAKSISAVLLKLWMEEAFFEQPRRGIL